MLCEAAVMHRGLIDVIGGGVTATELEAFPAPLELTFVFRAVLEPRALRAQHELRIGVAETANGFESFLDVLFYGPEGTETPTGEIALSAPVPLDAIIVPGPGRYLVTASLDHHAVGTYPLRVDGADDRLQATSQP